MNSLSDPFIKRPVMTTLVMALIVFFGLLAYKNLPVSDMPSVDYPTIEVTVSYPGASPDLMANSVAAPLEREFTALEDILTITSTSNTGLTTIVLQFHLNRNIDAASTDVQAAITAALTNLPDNLPNNPVYQKVNPTDTPILFYAIASNSMRMAKLYDYGFSFLGQRLGMVEGVAQIQTYGGPFAVRVQMDPDLLSAKQIGFDQVATTVSQGNPELPTGTLYGNMVEYTIDVDGQMFSADGYNALIVRNNEGNMVRISDMGEALNSQQYDKYSLKYMTGESVKNCVVVAILKQSGANAVKVINGIKGLMPQLQKELPASVEVATIFDQSEFIFESVHDVQFTLAIAFLLVAIVIFFYLGKVIDTFIPIVTLPLSVIGTFLVMYLCGFSLDILSLLSITLTIGFLVDDAIVVLENIVRHIEMGKTPMQAAMEGSKQISFTILSMTLCLAAVFIPLLFMAGIIGRIFMEFGAVIIIAVLFSGFISLTLAPLLCSRLLRPHSEGAKKNWLEKVSEKLNDGLLNIYKSGLKRILNHKMLTVIGGIAMVVATGYLFTIIPKNFLPMDDLGFIQGYTQAIDGTSSYRMMDYQEHLQNIAIKNPNVESLVSVGAIPIDSQGLFFIRLKPFKDRKPMQEVLPELFHELNDYPATNTFLRAIPLINLTVGTSSAQGNYQYTLQGFTDDDLYTSGQKIMDGLKKSPGFAQVSSDMHIGQPQLKVHILRDRAFDLNISAQAIEQALMFAYSGGRVSQINAVLNQYDVIVETLPADYHDPSVLDKIFISSQVVSNPPPKSVFTNTPAGLTPQLQEQPGTVQIPLSAVTEWSQEPGPLSINHFDTLPSVTITFDLDGVPLSNALETLETLAANTLPDDVSGSIQGTAIVFRQTFQSLYFLFFVALFVVYVVLGILYENFIHPITVMSALPPATVGALLSLMMFGYALDLYSFVGIMMLIGIVLKNGIILIDFANERRLHDNMGIEESMVASCHARFRPIIMTTFAAGMGAVPIMLGIGGMTAQSRKPLGLAIVGGLIFSQVVTLFLTPVVFIYMERMREFFQRKKKKDQPDPAQ